MAKPILLSSEEQLVNPELKGYFLSHLKMRSISIVTLSPFIIPPYPPSSSPFPMSSNVFRLSEGAALVEQT